MSRQYNIRWGRSDYARLSHLVRKVNQKVFEIEVKRPDIAGFQPKMLDYQDIKAEIKTRQDLNKFLNKYNRYLREGVEEVESSTRGAKATAWEVNEFNIAQRAENVRRANTRKRLGQMDVKIAGVSTGVKRAEMGSIKEASSKPSKKKFKNMSQKEWELAFDSLERKMRSTYDDERKRKMKENYIKGLESAGYSEATINLVKMQDLDKFVDTVDIDENATFDFIYDPVELAVKEERIQMAWSAEELRQSYIDLLRSRGIDEQFIAFIERMSIENFINGAAKIHETRDNFITKNNKLDIYRMWAYASHG